MGLSFTHLHTHLLAKFRERMLIGAVPLEVVGDDAFPHLSSKQRKFMMFEGPYLRLGFSGRRKGKLQVLWRLYVDMHPYCDHDPVKSYKAFTTPF